MKTKIFLCLALVWSVYTAALADTNTLQWGEMAGGFEMAADLDETNGIIHCYIRNATTNEMSYPSFDFGYFENISLQIRGATNWINPENFGIAVLPRSMGFSSACPNFVGRIPPGQVVTVTYTRSRARRWPVQTHEWYIQWAKGNTNEALLDEKLNRWYASRDALEAATGRDDTFAIDLFELNELASLPQGHSLEARVSQSFRTRLVRGRIATVYSPVFILSSSLLQSCVRENVPLSIRRAVNKP